MNKEIEIPEGYEARIDGNKVIIELKKSEDERIRKLLVWQVYRNIEDETNDLAGSVYDGVKGHDPDLEESIEDWKKCLAWLERQKEPQPADKLTLENPLTGEKVYEREIPEFMKGADPKDVEAIIHLTVKGWTVIAPGKEQKPAEWSEEDEKMLNRVFDAYDALRSYIEDNETSLEEDKNYQIKILEGDISWLKNWLKSPHPKHHWMPSEEQMSSLWQASKYYKSGKIKIIGEMLESLYNDLEKLYYE